MSKAKIEYQVAQTNSLQAVINSRIMDLTEADAPLSLPQMERLLIPFLNEIRRAQGKKPVIVPKG